MDLELALMDVHGAVILEKSKRIFLDAVAPLQPNLEAGFQQLFFIDSKEQMSQKPDHVQVTVSALTLVDAVQVPTKTMTLEWAEGLTPRSN